MHIHPDLRALRSDDTPQRDAQDALIRVVGAWRKQPRMAELLADLDAFATCRSLAECTTLAALFDEESGSAAALAHEFVQVTAESLERQPLGHVPLRHFTDGTVSTLLLARSGNVTLSLIAIDGDGLAARPAPVTADFSPSEVWERVLSGSASAELVERRSATREGAVLNRRAIALAPGKVVCRSAERQALLLRAVDGCLVSLRLQRRRSDAGPTREYRLDDGKLVHQAAGNPRDSRIELMMALLGRMERKDAAPQLSAIAQEEGSSALRWQALRECLALDTLAGFTALTAIARNETDELAAAAGALRSQLIEAHPQLAEVAACPVS